MSQMHTAFHWVRDMSNFDNRDTTTCLSCRFEVLINFGLVFALFLGAFMFDLEYFLFIVNVIKCYIKVYLLEHEIGVIFMGVVVKH